MVLAGTSWSNEWAHVHGMMHATQWSPAHTETQCQWQVNKQQKPKVYIFYKNLKYRTVGNFHRGEKFGMFTVDPIVRKLNLRKCHPLGKLAISSSAQICRLFIAISSSIRPNSSSLSISRSLGALTMQC